jgi:hypothetical protein
MIRKVVLAALLTLFGSSSSIAREPGVSTRPPDPVYGNKIIRIAPLSVMDIGVGVGVSYEHLFGSEQSIGLIIPVSLMLQNKAGYDYANSANTGAHSNTARYNSFVYFTPGIKIYPFGQRKVTYAVGPNLMLAYGGGKDWHPVIDDYGNTNYGEITVTRLRAGVLVNNYVNFQISNLLNVGMEGGLGMRYLDRESYTNSTLRAPNSTIANGFDVTGQFSMTLGLRF